MSSRGVPVPANRIIYNEKTGNQRVQSKEAFVFPSPAETRRETRKRERIVAQLAKRIRTVASGAFVFGSVVTGKNHSVHKGSDIDILLLITKTNVPKVLTLGMFDAATAASYVDGFRKGVAQGFTLAQDIEGVSVECHFWETAAYLRSFKRGARPLLRFTSSPEPKRSIAQAFNGQVYTSTLPVRKVKQWYVSPFPVEEIHDEHACPLRPITNILTLPKIIHGAEKLDPLFASVWQRAVEQLVKESPKPLPLAKYSILNSLPGNWKYSPREKKAIFARTKQELRQRHTAFRE